MAAIGVTSGAPAHPTTYAQLPMARWLHCLIRNRARRADGGRGKFRGRNNPIVLTSMKAGLIPKRVRIGASIHYVGGGGDARHGPVALHATNSRIGVTPSGRCEEIDFKICSGLGVKKIALGCRISDRWGVSKHLGSKIKSRKLWTRATHKYVRDIRRRRQFLIVRRTVVSCP
jgi:hypothetical protein